MKPKNQDRENGRNEGKVRTFMIYLPTISRTTRRSGGANFD